jgi:hypothetical protein
MSAQEWKEVTNQEQFIKFASSTYFQVKENYSICLIKDLFMQNKIPLSLYIENKDKNKVTECTILLYLVGTLLAKDEEYSKYKFLLTRLGVVTSVNDFLNLPDKEFPIIENLNSPRNEVWGENLVRRSYHARK